MANDETVPSPQPPSVPLVPATGGARIDANQLLNTVLRLAMDGVVVAEGAGGAVSLNETARRMAGIGAAEGMSQPPGRILFADPAGQEIPGDQTPLARSLRGETVSGEEYQLVRVDGAPASVMVHAEPVRNDAGAVTAAVAVLSDLSGQREIETRLLKARRDAERAEAGKARFLASASHELRHPVQAALLFAELLEEHVATEGGRELVARLVETLDGMKAMLDAMLDLSRLASGVLQPQPVEFPVADLLEAVAESYRPKAESAGLSFRLIRCGLSVVSDYELLSRILDQVIQNALKFTRHGHILLGCRRSADSLRIVVADTGRGIPQDQIEAMVEGNHGNGGRPHRTRGLGVGLAIVRGLAALLGHPMRIESKPGRGTLFEVVVPLAQPR